MLRLLFVQHSISLHSLFLKTDLFLDLTTRQLIFQNITIHTYNPSLFIPKGVKVNKTLLHDLISFLSVSIY